MTFTVVRVTAPDEGMVEAFLYEDEAVARVREIEAEGTPDDVFHIVRDRTGRAIWTTENGELEQVPLVPVAPPRGKQRDADRESGRDEDPLDPLGHV